MSPLANIIKIKSSATGGVAPGSLTAGELALNRADGLLYYANSAGAIVSLATKSGVNAKLDALATFDGVLATFALASGGVAVTPASASSLLVSMNGVIQEPLVDFTVSGSNITFTDIPASGDVFFGVHMTGTATNSVNAVTSTPSTIAANQNNYALPTGADIVRVSSSATYTITGIVAVTGAVVMLTNVGSFDVRLAHESASSTAANRVTTATGLDVVIAPNDSLTIVYDAVSARWRTSGSTTIGVATAYDFTRSSAPASATGSAGSWTFAIPTTATHITILCHGAGSGGGSGRKGALASGRSGGGGGAPGGWGEFSYKITDLSTNTVVVSVGAGGAGGAAVTVDSTNGNAGSSGGGGQVTCGGNTIANGYGTTGGAAGTATTAAAGGAQWTSQYTPNVTGNIGNSTVAGGTGQYNNHTSGSGGGGGGASAANVAYAGGAGGTAPVTLGAYGAPIAGTSGGGAGVAGATYFTRWGTGGSGGGGNASATGNGGAGGNAGIGGGGGGGGGSTNSGNTTYYSGAGGNGGNGFVRIIVWS